MKPLFYALITASLFTAGGAIADVKLGSRAPSDRAALSDRATSDRATSDRAVRDLDRTQAVPTGAGCTLLRPLSWNVTIHACLGGTSGPLQMVDGQEYTEHSIGGPLYGLGSITVRCDNGEPVTVRKSCRGGAGVPQ